MKTTMKQLTAIAFIAFLLMVSNVNAEGTETKTLVREAIETTLQVEDWMTDETIWNTNEISFFEITEETEPAMVLENWMISDKNWDNFDNVEETEEVLKVEDWMTSCVVWNQ